MGQYYSILTKNEQETLVWSMQCKKFRTTNNFDYYIGVKLMEHSYYGNTLTDAVSTYLYRNPTELYWVGDYADDVRPDIHEQVYGENTPKEYDYDFDESFDYNSSWFVNHTKKVAFQLLTPEKWNDWEIYPISLLTAVGNGMGGGDYFGDNMEIVGTWAGDIVSIEDALPQGYQQIPYPCFAEHR